MTYAEILAKLRTFEDQRFRNDNDLMEMLPAMTYDAVIEILTKLSEK